MIREAAETLKWNHDHILTERSTKDMVSLLAEAGYLWRNPEYPIRQLAIASCPDETGFPPEVMEAGLDRFFNRLTEKELRSLLSRDLGCLHRMDEFSDYDFCSESAQRTMGISPRLMVHYASGNLPIPTLMSLLCGLLIRSAQFVKCASGTSLVPTLFAHSIYSLDPKVGSCIELAEWPRNNDDLNQCLLEQADLVTATGKDETIQAIKSTLQDRVRCIGYGHRISFGYVAKESLKGKALKDACQAMANDVVAWNQQGCLSPHLFYIEEGGDISPKQVARLFADELQALEKTFPRGPISVEESRAIRTRRMVYEMRSAELPDTQVFQSDGSTSWTVVYDGDVRFQPSCLNRFVYIKGVEDLATALRATEEYREKVSTVGIASSGNRLEAQAMQLAQWGVSRICPLGRMQDPPLSWHHDGHPALADLISWSDWELPR